MYRSAARMHENIKLQFYLYDPDLRSCHRIARLCTTVLATGPSGLVLYELTRDFGYVLRNSCRSKNCMRSPVFVRALELTVPSNSRSNFATNHMKICAPCMNCSILCEGPDITVIVPRYGIGFGCRCAQKSCKIMHAFFT